MLFHCQLVSITQSAPADLGQVWRIAIDKLFPAEMPTLQKLDSAPADQLRSRRYPIAESVDTPGSRSKTMLCWAARLRRNTAAGPANGSI